MKLMQRLALAVAHVQELAHQVQFQRADENTHLQIDRAAGLALEQSRSPTVAFSMHRCKSLYKNAAHQSDFPNCFPGGTITGKAPVDACVRWHLTSIPIETIVKMVQ